LGINPQEAGCTTGVVLTGADVDAERFCACLTSAQNATAR